MFNLKYVCLCSECSIPHTLFKLLKESYLSSLGLEVNTQISMLVCIACEVAILPREVSTHISNHHRESGIRINLAQLEEACQRTEVVDEFPDMGYGPMEQIHLFQH